MSAIANLGLSLGGSLLGAVGQQAGYALGKATGYNNAIANDQMRQQQKLTDMQAEKNLALMKDSYKEQKKLWDATQAEAQVAHLKRAGLNPALLYKGGAGGSTSGGGGASVGGASASDEAARSNRDLATAGMGLQYVKAAAEIPKIKADTKKTEADTKTVDYTRDYLVNNLMLQGEGMVIENLRKEYENTGEEQHSEGDLTGDHSVKDKGYFGRGLTNSIANSLADTGNKNAQALLTNKRAEGYFQELLNGTANANANTVRAAADKLSKEWVTGEFTNWKTWVDLGLNVTGDILQGIGMFKEPKRLLEFTEEIAKGKKWSTRTVTNTYK